MTCQSQTFVMDQNDDNMNYEENDKKH